MDRSVDLTGYPLFLRCDATTAIGVGHVMRCLALGEAWQTYGGSVTLIGHIESEMLRERIYAAGVKYIPLSEHFSSHSDLRCLSALLLTLRDSEYSFFWHPWLVLDGYHFDTAYQSSVRKQGYRLCVVDDIAHLDFYDTDILLNQNIGADALAYSYPETTRVLLGPQYTMLRAQFLAWRGIERVSHEQASNILVTFGGSDLKNQIPKVLRALGGIEIANLLVKVVLGFDFKETDEFRQALDKASRLHTVELLQGVEDMPSLMTWADLAISAGGSTTYELAFLGVSLILVAIAKNQIGIVDGLGNAGAAVSLGWHEGVTEEEIARQFGKLSAAKNLRQEMAQIGQKLIDGHGRERVIEAFLQQNRISVMGEGK